MLILIFAVDICQFQQISNNYNFGLISVLQSRHYLSISYDFNHMCSTWPTPTAITGPQEWHHPDLPAAPLLGLGDPNDRSDRERELAVSGPTKGLVPKGPMSFVGLTDVL